jgi:hypothetical protein
MKWKFNTHYIVIKDSDDGFINVGDTLLLHYGNNYSLGDYTINTPPKSDAPTFFGLPQVNNCRYFKTKADLLVALKGTEVRYNTELALRLIADLQKKIDKIVENHELTNENISI